MLIKIITVGKRASNYQDSIDEYIKRLGPTQKIEWDFIPPSSYDEQKARLTESALILDKLKPSDVVWLLDERGEQITSTSLANKLNVLQNHAVRQLVIIIGGAYGVNDELRAKAGWQWSLSKLVFPHQLVRLILTEQLYRAHEINRGTAYHHV